jgi:hypothetical protein
VKSFLTWSLHNHTILLTPIEYVKATAYSPKVLVPDRVSPVKEIEKMQRQNFASLIRFSLVLSVSLLVVMSGGPLRPEASVQPVSFGAKIDFGTGSNSVSATASTSTQFSQQGPKLVGTGAVGNARQGRSVSLSADGNTAIVGGWVDNPTGAAWVWTRGGGVWTQQGTKLVGSGAVGNAVQGFSVSLSADGNTAIVGGFNDNGGAGAAWVWTRSGGVWTQQGAKLVGSGAVGNAVQGWSVSLSADGNTAIVGGVSDNGGAGAVWVWARSGGVWTQQGAKLVGSGAVGSATQGVSVSLSSDGNTVIVGGHSDGAAGAAWVWTRSGGVWTQQGAKLVGSGAVGNAVQGQSVFLSADGNTAIVGGASDNGAAGAAWVWTRSGGVWTQQGAKLVGSGAGAGNVQQGASVSLSADGNTAIIGGFNDNPTGAVWVWTRSGGVWTQQGAKLVGSGAVGGPGQGISVCLSADGNTAIVGGDSDNDSAGAAWVFTTSNVGNPCQVSVVPFFQAPPISPLILCPLSVNQLGNAPWACDQYDDHVNTTIREKGCAMTALAMALLKAGITTVPLIGQGSTPLNPGTLNQFMIEHSGDYDAKHNVRFDNTVQNISHSLKFLGVKPSKQQSTEALDQLLCQGVPVIVGVDLDLSNGPTHYVIVTGKQGNQYEIVDPGHRKTTLLDPNDGFSIRGQVVDPPGDVSALNLSVGDAELLIIDPTGNRTGFDSTGGTIREEIPRSTHFIDSLEDDLTGAAATEVSYSVPMFQPLQGTYQVVLTGLKLGMYTLSIRSFSQDGSPQPAVDVSGMTRPGLESAYLIEYSSTPGAALRVFGITATPVTRNAGSPSANSQIATVNDAQGAPNTLAVTVNGGTGATVNGVTVTLNPTAPDASGQVFADVVAACAATSASFTLRVTDSGGLFTETTLTVTVNPDVTAPTITCPGDVATAAAASCPNATSKVVTYPDPVASDNCAVKSVVCNPPSGSTLPVGTTTVICTATDTSGNTATCSFSVNVSSFCLQDEGNSGNVVLVNAQTGDYNFCCDGVPIASGRGTLTTHACIGSIDGTKGDRQVHIQWDTSANNGSGAGTAYVRKLSNKIVCQITDKNMSNNTCQCSAPPPVNPKKPPKERTL